jgi:lysozyme family protein
MADFTGIVLWVLQQEDRGLTGKVVDLGDGAGLTRFGIAQNAHPDLSADFYTTDRTSALQQAELIYEQQYWNRFMGDYITDVGVASCLLSFAINDGTAREVKMVQECVGVSVDGIMGASTLQHINAYNPQMLAAALRAAQADFYRAIYASNPAKYGPFINGWLARAARVYPSLA